MYNTSVDLLMYADDIVLLSNNQSGLQKHLNTLELFCQNWKLDLNSDKTKVCVFGKRTCTGQFHWKGQCLEIVQLYCYLGICLSSSGKYSEARKHVAKQARKATFPLLNLFARLNHPPMSVMLKLYEAYLIPIMCYGSEIWGFQEDRVLKKLNYGY